MDSHKYTHSVLDNLTSGLINHFVMGTESRHTSHSHKDHDNDPSFELNPSQMALIVSVTSVSYYCILVIAALGIVLNLFVVGKLWCIRKAQPDLKPASILMVMSFTDVLCLVFVLLNTLGERVSTETKKYWLSDWWSEDLFCKVTCYVVYLGSTFGIWAWITLSGQRFLCIVCPVFTLKHKKWVKSSSKQLLVLILFCAGQQIWTFVAAEYKVNEGCTMSTKVIWEHDYDYFLWADSCLMFLLPVAIIMIMEFMLRRHIDTNTSLAARRSVRAFRERTTTFGGLSLWSSAASNLNRKETSVNDNQASLTMTTQPNNAVTRSHSHDHLYVTAQMSPLPNSQSASMAHFPFNNRIDDNSTLNDKRLRRNVKLCRRLRRFLFLTSFDVALNLPYVLLRVVYGSMKSNNKQSATAFTVECVLSGLAMILYYGQYSLNILYIWVLYSQLAQRNKPRTLSPSLQSVHQSAANNLKHITSALLVNGQNEPTSNPSALRQYSSISVHIEHSDTEVFL